MDDTATPVSTMYGSSFDLPSATTAGRVYGLGRRVEEGGTPVTPTRQGQQTSATPSCLPRIDGRAAMHLRMTGGRIEPVARQLERRGIPELSPAQFYSRSPAQFASPFGDSTLAHMAPNNETTIDSVDFGIVSFQGVQGRRGDEGSDKL